MEDSANDRGTGGKDLSEAAPVTVAEVLRLPMFSDVVVVAGRSGLDRLVARANIMEVPDILPWVKPDELLLTTGYPLRDVPQGLVALVAALDDAGVSALGVKLRRYLHELPPDMLSAADQRGFPVLLLPDGIAFDELLSAVMGEVLNRQSTVLERSDVVHRALVSVALDGGGLEELVEELADREGHPTMVTTTDGRVLAEARDPTGVLGHRAGAVFDPSGRFRAERFATGRHGIDGVTLEVVPVIAGKVDHGRLVVVREGPPLGDGDLHMLNRAATVAALVITKTLAVRAVEAKYRGDFMRDVLQDRAGGAGCGRGALLLARMGRRPAAARGRGGARRAGQRDHPAAGRAPDRPGAVLQRLVDSRRPPRPDRAGDRLRPGGGRRSSVSSPIRTRQAVVSSLVRAVSGDGGGGRHTFATGASRVVRQVAGIPAGYEQARRAAQVGRQLRGPSAVAHFDDLGAFRLLSLVADVGELRSFVHEVLGELAVEGDPEAADMRATLRVLLDTNLNVAETSRRLHFHYNTLRYRITKLERMLGPFVSDPDLQLDLALALRVLQMQNV